MGIKMDFSKQDRVTLLEFIKKDTKWLGRRRLIDYSLLVGIERVRRPKDEEQCSPGTSSTI